MKDFLIYIAQSAICSSMFLLIYQVFLRKTTFFVFNRLFLLLGLLVSFTLPAFHFSYDVILPAIPSGLITTTDVVENVVVENKISIWSIIAGIYLFGLVLVLMRNITMFRKLYKLMQNGNSVKYNKYNLKLSDEVKTPFSIFNYIFLNTKCKESVEKEIILKHEISHIDQKHWIDLLCSECALLLQWFNPLMWLYIHFQKENHEYLADQAVLNGGESPAVYRAVLINQRFQGPVFSFVNSFNYSNQQNRLTMMKKTKTSPWKKIAVLAILPLFGVFFALSAKPNYVIAHMESNTDVQAIKDGDQPYIIIDGKEATHKLDELGLDPNLIESMEVFKDSIAIAKFGSKGKNGVIVITSKTGEKPSIVSVSGTSILQYEVGDTLDLDIDKIRSIAASSKSAIKLGDNNELIIVDGKEINLDELKSIDSKLIESMNVLKDSSAVKVYGAKGKNGVIIIDTKKNK